MQDVEPALDWENLRVFGALHRHRSFAAAARELRVDATTLSRRLTQLEDELGVLLFQRTTLGLTPTEAADAIAASVQRIERQVELLRGEAAGKDAAPRGVVRLASAAELVDAFLMPRYAALRARHPELELQLITGDRYVDLTRGEADLAIRFQLPGRGVPADPRATIEVTAQRLGAIDFAVYASAAYLKRARRRPRDAHDVEGHDLVLPRAAAAYLPGSPWFARVEGRGRAALRVDGPGSMSAAVVGGLGIGVMPTMLVEGRDPVRLGAREVVDTREIWLLSPADLARVARVRVVRDFIVELASAFRT